MLPAVAGSFHYPQTTRNFIARQFHQATLSWGIIRSIIDVQLLVSPPTDDTYSAFRYSFHSDCFCIVLDKWSTSTTKSSSWAQKTPFYWEFSFNAQHTRMGDVCELGTRIQSVMGRDSDLPHSSNVLCRFRYYSCQRFRNINDYLKFLQSRYRPSRPKIQ